MSAYLVDAQRGTPVSCRRGDKAAAMASYTKQAKDESLERTCRRSAAMGRVVGSNVNAESTGGAREAFQDVRVAIAARRGSLRSRGVRRHEEFAGLLAVVCPAMELHRDVNKVPASRPLTGTRNRLRGELAAHVQRLEPGGRVTRGQV